MKTPKKYILPAIALLSLSAIIFFSKPNEQIRPETLAPQPNKSTEAHINQSTPGDTALSAHAKIQEKVKPKKKRKPQPIIAIEPAPPEIILTINEDPSYIGGTSHFLDCFEDHFNYQYFESENNTEYKGTLTICIDKAGMVSDIRLNPETTVGMHRAIKAAVMGCNGFRPGRLNSKTVPSQIEVPLNLRLRN